MDLDWDMVGGSSSVSTSVKKHTLKKKPAAILKSVASSTTSRSASGSTVSKTELVAKASRRVLSVGSCCTGLATDEMALEQLGVPYKSAFMCEINDNLRTSALRLCMA